jgi:precorrin-6B methylase 2
MKRTIIGLIDRTTAFACYSQWRSSYLADTGWYESFRQRRAIDRQGQPLPWITYPAIAFLGPRLTKSMAIFEYGCGNSTRWLAARVGSVVSCEHEQVWYDEIKPTLPANAALRLRALDGGYAPCVSENGSRYDVIFIDGRNRNDCIRAAVGSLKPGGVIILDNSERDDYAAGIAQLIERGFRAIAFDGPGPIVSEAWRTTVFYQSQANCLGI